MENYDCATESNGEEAWHRYHESLPKHKEKENSWGKCEDQLIMHDSYKRFRKKKDFFIRDCSRSVSL